MLVVHKDDNKIEFQGHKLEDIRELFQCLYPCSKPIDGKRRFKKVNKVVKNISKTNDLPKISYICLDFVLNENSYQEKMPRSETKCYISRNEGYTATTKPTVLEQTHVATKKNVFKAKLDNSKKNLKIIKQKQFAPQTAQK